MLRFTMLAVALLALTGVSSARGQDTDEVKRLKEKIELLQAKLEAANLKVEKLQGEVEQLKAGGAGAKPAADGGFGVGTKLVGKVTRSWTANGKQVVMGDQMELEVTKRSGKEFTAECWADNRKVGMEVEGTIENGVVKFSTTKSLTEGETLNLVGLHTFTGRFEKGVLTGTTKKKGDASYSGKWELKSKKE